MGQDDSIFMLGAPREKKSHFDPKHLITGGTKIWPEKIQSLAEQKFDPNFWVKMPQFFCFVHQEKKMSHFDPKHLITGGTKIWPKKIQSLAEQKFDPNFWVKMPQFFCFVHREKKKWVILTQNI